MKEMTKNEAINNLLDYYYDEEKRHLEEHIATVYDIEDDMTDEELYKYCIDNDVEHIWISLYILSK